jgi:hypothetical protein
VRAPASMARAYVASASATVTLRNAGIARYTSPRDCRPG